MYGEDGTIWNKAPHSPCVVCKQINTIHLMCRSMEWGVMTHSTSDNLHQVGVAQEVGASLVPAN